MISKGWGHGPPLSEAVPLTLTLPGAPVTVQVLDSLGQPKERLPANGNQIRIESTLNSLWFYMTR